MDNTRSLESMGGELQVVIQTPEGVVWEGNAQAVSSENSTGVFDLLPDHANIITLIERKPITINTLSGSREFTFEKAIVSMENNRVSVFADIVSATKNSNLDSLNISNKQ
jgi:F-type H+-transporting ATPase subunit epsilon